MFIPNIFNLTSCGGGDYVSDFRYSLVYFLFFLCHFSVIYLPCCCCLCCSPKFMIAQKHGHCIRNSPTKAVPVWFIHIGCWSSPNTIDHSNMDDREKIEAINQHHFWWYTIFEIMWLKPFIKELSEIMRIPAFGWVKWLSNICCSKAK